MRHHWVGRDPQGALCCWFQGTLFQDQDLPVHCLEQEAVSDDGGRKGRGDTRRRLGLLDSGKGRISSRRALVIEPSLTVLLADTVNQSLPSTGPYADESDWGLFNPDSRPLPHDQSWLSW